MALATIDALGGGLLLYLTQEGCGIGLANKMRAYRLQDEGLDTIDANTTLGFERDERRYEAAAQMLRSAGFERVALLTNNPSKVDALRAAGIDVRERIPLLAPVRGGNRRYLETKSRRAGHLIGDTTVPGT
jgi:GTP cyclohydrolase II